MNLKTTTLTFTGALLLALCTTTSSDAAIKGGMHYSTGNFELTLDGLTPSYVSTVDGGVIVADAVVEPGARGNFVKKKPSAGRFEPLNLSLALSGGTPKPWFDWLNGCMNGTEKAKNGSIAFLDVNFKEVQRRSFTNLRLAEMTLSKTDARENKKPLEVDLSFVGDSVTETKGGGAQSANAQSNKSRSLLASNFKVTMPGLDTSFLLSVDSITVKMAGGGTPAKGADVLKSEIARAAPRAEVAPFSVRISERSSDTWKAWYQSFVVRGQNSDAEEKTMTIEYLDPTLRTVLLRVRLDGVGIVGLAPSGALEAGKEGMNDLQADLYAESFRFEPVATK